MKSNFKKSLLLIFFISFCSFQVHKFYVSVTQIDLATDKKELQITMRIFVDDMNTALEKKHSRKFYIASNNITTEDLKLMKDYLKEHFSIKVNQKPKEVVFYTKEMEDDVLICYLKVENVSKVTSLEVNNSLFLDVFTEQQNIIHTKISGNKKSLLLTESNSVGLLKYK